MKILTILLFIFAITVRKFATSITDEEVSSLLQPQKTEVQKYVHLIGLEIQDAVRKSNKVIEQAIESTSNASAIISSGYSVVKTLQTKIHEKYNPIVDSLFLSVPESVKKLIRCNAKALLKAESYYKNQLDLINNVIAVSAEASRDSGLQIMYRVFNEVYNKLLTGVVSKVLLISISQMFQKEILDTWIEFLVIVHNDYDKVFATVEKQLTELIKNTIC